MWAALVILAVAFGWSLVRLLPFRWQRVEALAAAVALGFTLAPWVYFLVALVSNWSFAMIAATLLLAVASVGSWWLIPRRLEFEGWPRITAGSVCLWGAAVVVIAWLGYLAWSSYAFASTGDWYTNGNVWGDSPLHVALITQFAHGDKLDLVSPVYERMALTYPLISDFWSGVLMRVSNSWILSLAVPSVIMMVDLLVLLYFAGYRLLKSRTGAWLAWYMLVFSGPVAGAYKVIGGLLAGSGDYTTLITSLGNGGNYAYLNFAYSHLLPQRSYLFGMALLVVAALVALELYRRRSEDAKYRQHLRVAGVLGGVMVGLMPLVHTHSFLVMAVLGTIAGAALWWRERKLPDGWIWMGATAAILAIPQVLWQEAHSYPGFSHFSLGFTGTVGGVEQTNWFAFWVCSLGWLCIFAGLGWYVLVRMRVRAEIWVVYAVGVILFAAANIYVFQPSTWDNMKLFEYSAWFLMLASAAVFAGWCKSVWGRVATGVIMVSVCAAGFITLVPGARAENYELLSHDEVRFGQHMQSAMPADAYVLVGDRHNSPITMFSDRKVLMTYAGWYNLYGSDWEETMANRQIMLEGGPGAADLIERYQVNFAAFSDSEVYSEGINLSYFQSHYKLFDYEAGWWVFDLRKQA